MAPEWSRSAIDGLRRQREAIAVYGLANLHSHLNVSYFPEGFKKIADKAGVSADNLRDSIQADLREGIAVQTTSWTTREGRTKCSVVSSQWSLVLRPQDGERTRRSLAVLESVQQLHIPTRQLTFRPVAVSFHRVKDEHFCDLDDLLKDYSTCKRSHELQQRIDEDLERRDEAFRKVKRKLQDGEIDPAILARESIHASVRRQYSALRVMMDLLKLRNEQEKHSLVATVLPPDAHPDSVLHARVTDELANGNEEAALAPLWLQLRDRLPASVLDEGTSVEVQQPSWTRARRAQVVSVTTRGEASSVALDLQSGTLCAGDEVVLHIVARFGMRAHQRAIRDFRNERVKGYWPHLAQLLCLPKQLSPASNPSPPVRFYCDADPAAPPLNERQRRAVSGAIATPHAFCIQGPPGTGKTTVICELVQQLIARGERILLVAPSHVAVDEVLRRIGTRQGVRALRLSWDDARVAEDVRKFMPTNIIEPFIERSRTPNAAKAGAWQQERNSIGAAVSMLQTLRTLQDKRRTQQLQKQRSDVALDESRRSLDNERGSLHAQLERLGVQLRAAEVDIGRHQQELRVAEDAYQGSLTKSGWRGKALGWIGLGGIGRTRRQRSAVARKLREAEQVRNDLWQSEQAATSRLDGLKTTVAEAEKGVDLADTLLDETVRDESAATAKCAGQDILRDHQLDSRAVNELITELRDRDARLKGYRDLAERFDELVAEVREEGGDLEGLRRDLLAISNLFCCTTTGVAGSQELQELVLDTLIVDEASRVTDSEFLIGAIRAKRWVIVGDEHQLPPYVEQNDEHFIHALSALHQAETTSKELAQAVDDLGILWEEDEELHQFRRANVLAVAENIRDSGHWKSSYSGAYQSGIKDLRNEVDDPSRALLRAMRDNLVHSLFERVVGSCPDAMRVRLVEQRRMIEPLASIVSEPVYGGDYCTPSPEELALRRVTPLTTSTFPTPITFLDTSMYRKTARDELRQNSFINPFEADWIVQACKTLDRELSQAGSRPVTVSILSFYKAQARLIDDLLAPNFRPGKNHFACLRRSVIDAIDRIQGQESDVVFLSFCRTAGKQVSPGFGQWLQDLRRLNVACTRAHRALFFVGQKELLGKLCSNEPAMKFYRHLNDLFDRRPDVMRVVQQFGNRSA
jgi:hypothetical protein